jgi:hypothetical protein
MLYWIKKLKINIQKNWNFTLKSKFWKNELRKFGSKIKKFNVKNVCWIKNSKWKMYEEWEKKLRRNKVNRRKCWMCKKKVLKG